ncbi:hypothetical protein CU669_02570 [Paramagnetospirillum kuznetsovii]|uniref:Uncharacterized protein n=1 Tax=Paramagnetospirillum kuznetsovii TaxID=2053833 RepID=A0A364P3Q1_9PROT|nr:hypothetical protein [Paramagnetospirillum kuznetsovii]RAU23969.1 hypothetical protein CU669_02570 [Paramagnetospirillum kuznetsovii]
MRRVFALLTLLVLSACYQVDGEAVPMSSSIRVDGVKDGRYRRPDGVEVAVRWNEAEKLYDVIADGAEKGRGGTARAARIAPGIFLVQYMDATRVAVLAKLDHNDLILFAPTKATEQQLLGAHGLSLRPGPINSLLGSMGGIRNFFKDLAASGGFAEGGRMVYLN